jgi:hypothetical protein
MMPYCLIGLLAIEGGGIVHRLSPALSVGEGSIVGNQDRTYSLVAHQALLNSEKEG